jgi:hypothetical protein
MTADYDYTIINQKDAKHGRVRVSKVGAKRPKYVG